MTDSMGNHIFSGSKLFHPVEGEAELLVARLKSGVYLAYITIPDGSKWGKQLNLDQKDLTDS